MQTPSGQPAIAHMHREHGRRLDFTLSGSTWVPSADNAATLIELKNWSGQRTGWQFMEADARGVETFDVDGKLTRIAQADGQSVDLTYDNGQNGTPQENALVTTVEDQNGRTLELDYDTGHRLVGLVDAAGGVYAYGYDSEGRLVTVTYPGMTTRTYLYNESALNDGSHQPCALTG